MKTLFAHASLVALFVFAAGCSKLNPERPASCCSGCEVSYIEEVKGELGDVFITSSGQYGVFFLKAEYPSTYPAFHQTGVPMRVKYMGVCEKTLKKVQNPALDIVDKRNGGVFKPVGKCRLWGRIFRLHIPTLTATPVLLFYADRIENVQ